MRGRTGKGSQTWSLWAWLLPVFQVWSLDVNGSILMPSSLLLPCREQLSPQISRLSCSGHPFLTLFSHVSLTIQHIFEILELQSCCRSRAADTSNSNGTRKLMDIQVVLSAVSNTAFGKRKVKFSTFKISLCSPVWVYGCSPVALVSLGGDL